VSDIEATDRLDPLRSLAITYASRMTVAKVRRPIPFV
jgi:hypothetical protein